MAGAYWREGVKKQRLTYAIRCAAVAAWPTKNPSRANALCGVFLRHIFAVAGNLRFPLSQLQKRRIAFTLCEIKV
jgi:hypothetical protein